MTTMHYAGRLAILNARTKRITHIGQGYAACCSGDRAIAIAERGENTLDRSAVTCKSCLRQIERADFTKHMRPDIKHWAEMP
jgi:prefoldin subunit 5